MFVFKAGVVGAGTMGGEIAQLVAAAGIPVVLRDVEQRFVDVGLEKARQLTAGRLDGLHASGKLTREQADEQLERTLALIAGTTSLDGFGDVDFVIEAVPERLELKLAVFAELDAATPGHAILASNTSALSISELAAATTRPEQVLGFHFFYPASVMRLVEIVEGDRDLARVDGRRGELRRRDPQDLDPLRRRARFRRQPRADLGGQRAVARAGGAGSRHRRARSRRSPSPAPRRSGPFALADMLGLDTVLHVAEHLHEAFGERFHVHAGMRELVAEGELGVKTGRGFYEAGAPRAGGSELGDVAELVERFALKALVECCLLLEEGVAVRPRHRRRR